MISAIISDIHDNQENLKKCLAWCAANKIDSIICCGDIANIKTASYLSKNFPGDIYVVAGNADLYDERDLNKFKNIHFYGEIAVNEIGGVNIGFCHEPEKIKKIKELAPFNLDFIFYGHTHKPWLEKEDGIIIANPGTLAGLFTPATFSILDHATKNLELKILSEI